MRSSDWFWAWALRSPKKTWWGWGVGGVVAKNPSGKLTDLQSSLNSTCYDNRHPEPKNVKWRKLRLGKFGCSDYCKNSSKIFFQKSIEKCQSETIVVQVSRPGDASGFTRAISWLSLKKKKKKIKHRALEKWKKSKKDNKFLLTSPHTCQSQQSCSDSE